MTTAKSEMLASEAARYVGVSVTAVYQRRDAQKLEGRLNDDGVWIFPVAGLDRWREERRLEAERRLAALR